MKTPKDYMKALAKKGEVTIVEHVDGKTMVALQSFSGAGVVVLQGWTTKDQLVAELCQMCQDYPDMPNAKRTRQ